MSTTPSPSAPPCLDTSITVCAKIANFNLLPSHWIADFSTEIEADERSRLHYMWIIPINIAASVIGIVLAPIAFAINLVTALIFRIAGCFLSSAEKRETCNLAACGFTLLAFSQITCMPFILLTRIVAPSCKCNCDADSIDPSQDQTEAISQWDLSYNWLRI